MSCTHCGHKFFLTSQDTSWCSTSSKTHDLLAYFLHLFLLLGDSSGDECSKPSKHNIPLGNGSEQWLYVSGEENYGYIVTSIHSMWWIPKWTVNEKKSPVNQVLAVMLALHDWWKIIENIILRNRRSNPTLLVGSPDDQQLSFNASLTRMLTVVNRKVWVW